MFRMVKRILIGKPLESARLASERLSKIKALAVYSSDALSSVAYATEEILWVLAPLGAVALSFSLPVAGAILLLLAVLVISYRQTIYAYPSGGGAYIVAKENLGQLPGLVAGASLVIDYVLTVAVSIASGVAAVTSAFPTLLPYKVALCLFFVLVLMLINLRGISESASVFAAPTYIFIFTLLGLIGLGIFKKFTGQPIPPAPMNAVLGSHPASVVGLWVLMRAFSSGCTALTGVEAISNGVPSFREPRSHNAAITLTVMGLIIVCLFGGITYLAQSLHVTPNPNETVVSQIAALLAGRSWFYYLLQGSTALILILAANTSYNGFPLVTSLIAKDGYLPRLLSMRGDRLVFSNGIAILSLFSALLLVVFKGSNHALIPLYAVGVFLSFTLSQTGMIMHWVKSGHKGWQAHAVVAGLGAVLSGAALVVIAITKFVHGAWVVVIFIPLLVSMFQKIHNHYVDIADQLRVVDPACVHPDHIKIIIPVAGFTKPVLNTVEYAKSLTTDLTPVHIALDDEQAAKLQAKWEKQYPDLPLKVIPSPYRSLLSPLLEFLDQVEKNTAQHEIVMVLIPEFITHTWWQYLLHNQSGLLLKQALIMRKSMVVSTVPYHLAKPKPTAANV